jgi:NIPSNAP
MIHELRIYHVLPGGMPGLLQQFEKVTIPIWKKHGIEQLGFWTVLTGESNHDLYYVLEWESLAEREQKWNDFQADPDWVAARSEAAKDGPRVASVSNMFLRPTAFSRSG